MFRTCGYFNHAPNGIANSVRPIPSHAVPGQLPETVEEAEETGAGAGGGVTARSCCPFHYSFGLWKGSSERKA